MRIVWGIALAALLMPVSSWAALPEGPGKELTVAQCSSCHEIEKSVSLRQDRAGWGETVTKMIDLGATIEGDDMVAIVNYLAASYPLESRPPLNVNKARAIQMEARLALKRSEASAIIRYRREHGDFESIDDLKNVPGIDFAKIEAKRDSIAF